MVIERPYLEDFMYAYALGEEVTSQVFHLALYLFLVLLNHVQSLIREVLYIVLVLHWITCCWTVGSRAWETSKGISLVLFSI